MKNINAITVDIHDKEMLHKLYDDFQLDKSKVPATLSSCVAFKQKHSIQTLCLIRFMHRI
jgi:hypothetical protein